MNKQLAVLEAEKQQLLSIFQATAAEIRNVEASEALQRARAYSAAQHEQRLNTGASSRHARLNPFSVSRRHTATRTNKLKHAHRTTS